MLMISVGLIYKTTDIVIAKKLNCSGVFCTINVSIDWSGFDGMTVTSQITGIETVEIK